MILKNKKLLVITSLLILLPIPVGLLLWDKFPETMAVHFGLTGQADGFASIPTAVFLPSLLMLLTHWFCILVTFFDKGNRNRNQKLQSIVLWTIPVICNMSCCGLYALALGVEFSPVLWTMVPMGLLFALIGNFLPKTRMNSTMGIKVPWAYSSEENWNATHRFAGKLWVIGGIVMLLGIFLPEGAAIALMVIDSIVLCAAPMVYSWKFWKKQKAEGVELKDLRLTNPKLTKAVIVLLAAILIFTLSITFTGNIDYAFGENALTIEADWYSDMTIRYDSIKSLEYREGSVPSTRVGGFGSLRLLMGYFKNEEFGTHIRYSYYDPDACIILSTERQTFVLSGKNTQETREIYDLLLKKIS